MEPRGFVEVGGKRLEYQWIGPPPDRRSTMVFLHEGLDCVELWKGFPERLAERTGLGALVYSRAGYGRSDPGERPLPLDYHVTEALQVLPELLDKTAIERAVLIGSSDGGTIALIHVGAGHGDRIAGVIVAAAHVFNEDITIAGIEEARQAYLTTGVREKLARYHGANVDGAFWGWCDAWLSPAFRTWNVEHYLPSITVPLLVMQGGDDHYGSAAQVDAIARQVKGTVETLILPDCGHSMHLDRPAETLEAMARFIDRLELNQPSR